MNIRCMYCQTPFTISMNDKIGALRRMHTEGMHHYDAYCPRCRRANSVSRERLEMFTPGWQQAISAPVPASTEVPTRPPLTAPAPATPKVESPSAPTTSRAKHPSAAKKPAGRKPVTTAKSKTKAKPASKPATRKPKAAVKKSK
jgi:hypothetical protein